MGFNPEELDEKKDVVQMIQGEENVVPLNLYCYSSSQKIIDGYSEASGVFVLFNYPEFQRKHKEALSRGVRIRVLTEITKDNLPYIKGALQRYISDIRHLDTITHHFAVSEKHFLSCKVVYGNPNLTQCIFSNIGWFVREQQYLFENMWEKAIPLKQRIREIEEGSKREFVDTLREPAEVLNLLPKVISSAYEEIMLLFPNSDTLTEFESSGLAESINNHIQKNSNVRVRLLLKNKQKQHFFSSQAKASGGGTIPSAASDNTLIGQNNVEVKFVSPDKIDTNTALVIADGEKMLTIEFEQESDYSSSSPAEPNLSESIRFATHTNSESAIMSHISIFERLWIESEMKQR
ncbi:MAG TPA: hypothetical protein VE544_10740 [Nitrososphaeraceae archaeon]|jgi:hypothetical protein|nr:hypothetical protein [Nitrososphaeraceae archaeon]